MNSRHQVVFILGPESGGGEGGILSLPQTVSLSLPL